MDRFVVISGCSSGGKSTLIAELAKRRYAVVDEPGRRIVKEELARGGSALPWVDRVAFARRAIAIALADRAVAGSLDGWVFFDRGLIDAAAALEHMTSKPVLTALDQANPTIGACSWCRLGGRFTRPIRNGVTDWMWPWPNIRAYLKLIRRSVTKS